MIELSSVYVKLNDKPYEKVKAYVDIVFNDLFVIHNLVLRENRDGELKLYFPNNVKRKTIAHPLSEDLRKHIEINVLNKYEYIRRKYGDSVQSNN